MSTLPLLSLVFFRLKQLNWFRWVSPQQWNSTSGGQRSSRSPLGPKNLINFFKVIILFLFIDHPSLTAFSSSEHDPWTKTHKTHKFWLNEKSPQVLLSCITINFLLKAVEIALKPFSHMQYPELFILDVSSLF